MARVIRTGRFRHIPVPLSGQLVLRDKTAYLVPFAPFDWIIGIAGQRDIDALIQRRSSDTSASALRYEG
jgi:hypothetical protein